MNIWVASRFETSEDYDWRIQMPAWIWIDLGQPVEKEFPCMIKLCLTFYENVKLLSNVAEPFVKPACLITTMASFSFRVAQSEHTNMELTSRTSGMYSGSNHLLRKWWVPWHLGHLSELHSCHSGEWYRDRYSIYSVPWSSCFCDAKNMYVTPSSIPDPTLPHFCSLGSGQRWVGLIVWHLYQFDWCVCSSLYFSCSQLDLLQSFQSCSHVMDHTHPASDPPVDPFRAATISFHCSLVQFSLWGQ